MLEEVKGFAQKLVILEKSPEQLSLEEEKEQRKRSLKGKNDKPQKENSEKEVKEQNEKDTFQKSDDDSHHKNFTEQLLQREHEIHQLRTELMNKTREVMLLNRQFESSKILVGDTQKEMQRHMILSTELQSRVDELTQELQESERRSEERLAELSFRRNDVKVLKEQLELEKGTCEVAQQNVERLEKELERVSEIVQIMEQKSMDMTTKSDTNSNNIQDLVYSLQSQLQEQKGKCKALEIRLREEKSEFETRRKSDKVLMACDRRVDIGHLEDKESNGAVASNYRMFKPLVVLFIIVLVLMWNSRCPPCRPLVLANAKP